MNNMRKHKWRNIMKSKLAFVLRWFGISLNSCIVSIVSRTKALPNKMEVIFPLVAKSATSVICSVGKYSYEAEDKSKYITDATRVFLARGQYELLFKDKDLPPECANVQITLECWRRYHLSVRLQYARIHRDLLNAWDEEAKGKAKAQTLLSCSFLPQSF